MAAKLATMKKDSLRPKEKVGKKILITIVYIAVMVGPAILFSLYYMFGFDHEDDEFLEIGGQGARS